MYLFIRKISNSFLAAVFTTFVSLVCAYQIGDSKGMAGVVPDAVDTQNRAIALSISRDIYGYKGYIGHRDVLNALIDGGMTQLTVPLSNQKRIYPDNVRDGALMDGAIQAALSLGSLSKGSFNDRTLICGEYDDLGLTDYYSLSFKTFGYNIAAPFKFYFLLLGLSALLFAFSFGRSKISMLLLSAWSFAVALVISSVYFDEIALATVHNQRFLSTLAILPFVHIALEISANRDVTRWNLFSLILQTILLVFAWTIRQSVIWAIIAIFLVISISAYQRKDSWCYRTNFREKFQNFFNWQITIFSVLFIMVASLRPVFYDPIYKLEDVLPHRMTWHSAFLGLAVHPQWGLTEATSEFKGVSGDTIAIKQDLTYTSQILGRNIDESYLISPLTATYKFGRHEKIMRVSYLNFLIENPGYSLELHLLWKPKRLLEIVGDFRSSKGADKLLLLSFFIFAAMALFIMKSPTNLNIHNSPHMSNVLSQVLIIGFPISLLPALWAFPSKTTASEQLLYFFTITLLYSILFMKSIIGYVAQKVK